MKQLLILFCVAALCSCGFIKKTTNKTQTNTDSTGSKTSVHLDVKKADSAGTATSVTKTTKTSENGYKETTVTKEYFSDELDFEGEAEKDKPAKDTGKASVTIPASMSANATAKRKFLYRETTTTREGAFKTNEAQVQQTDQKSTVQKIDSSKHEEGQTSNVSTGTKTDQGSKTHITLVPWYVIIILIIALVLFIIYKVRKAAKKVSNQFP